MSDTVDDAAWAERVLAGDVRAAARPDRTAAREGE